MRLDKEIKSKDGNVHFRRWVILEFALFRIYLHHIYREDMDKHCHSHPWSFVVLCLSGRYSEEMRDGTLRFVRPFSLRYRNKYDYHKIKMIQKHAVKTIVFAWGRHTDDWGYLVDGNHVQFEEYRKLKREGRYS